MDFSSFFSLIQTIIVLIIVIFLANISLRLLNKYMHKQNKLINVVERISVLSNSSISIVEVCGTYYLMSFTDKDNKILKELNKEEVELIIEEMETKQSYTDLKTKANLHFGMRKKS